MDSVILRMYITYIMANSADHYNSPFGGFTWRGAPEMRLRLLSVTRVAGRELPADFRVRHSCWALDYFLTPGARIRVGSTRQPWREREAFTAHLYPPGCSYWEDSGGRAGSHRSTWITFETGPGSGLEALVQNPQGFARFEDPGRHVDALLSEIAASARGLGDEGYWDAIPPCFSLLGLLRRAIPVGEGVYQISRGVQAGVRHALVVRVEEYFRTHLAEHIDVPLLARQVHMAPSALIRRYRLETGVPPMTALARMRVQVAKSLLVQGQTMKAIAAQLGFCDAFHFSKVFKKLEGMSPSEYLSRSNRRP